MKKKQGRNDLAFAISLAAVKHIGQSDKGGNPYILHPLWVMNNVRHLGKNAMIVGILHDVVEDTTTTLDELRKHFDTEVIDALALLDMRGVDYQERIKLIYHNKLARAIKLADIEHNSRITRLKGINAKDYARFEKYSIAYLYLKN